MSSLQSLPYDIRIAILGSSSTFKDLASLSQTCKAFSEPMRAHENTVISAVARQKFGPGIPELLRLIRVLAVRQSPGRVQPDEVLKSNEAVRGNDPEVVQETLNRWHEPNEGPESIVNKPYEPNEELEKMLLQLPAADSLKVQKSEIPALDKMARRMRALAGSRDRNALTVEFKAACNAALVELILSSVSGKSCLERRNPWAITLALVDLTGNDHDGKWQFLWSASKGLRSLLHRWDRKEEGIMSLGIELYMEEWCQPRCEELNKKYWLHRSEVRVVISEG